MTIPEVDRLDPHRGDTKKALIPTVCDFLQTRCIFDPNVNTLSASLTMAFARWRRQIEAQNGVCIWDDLVKEIVQRGCRRDLSNGTTVWQGIALKANGPHPIRPPRETPPARKTYAPCPVCGCMERWKTTRGTRICVDCFLKMKTSAASRKERQ